MKKIHILSIASAGIMLFTQCSTDNNSISKVDENLNAQVISDFSLNVANAQYVDLKTKTTLLYQQVLTLEMSKTDNNLALCRQTWRDARLIWEQSEAQLFGPVETDNIDPRIDTWPVNFTDLDAQLASSNVFTEDYINSLEDALKGFHPIEYILFGSNGNKAASSLTTREIEYLKALTLNVKTLTSDLADVWSTSLSTSFYQSFTTAGKGSTLYPTQQEALDQLVAAMADICGEVGSSKMNEVYMAQDPTLEESPFAQNSMTDFTNNIKGIGNVYQGKYTVDGKGLEDIVRKYNLSLDNEIKTKLSAAIDALGNITDTFGKAIKSQKPQVEAAIKAIDDLKLVLNDDDDLTTTDLAGFIKQHSK